MDDLYFIYIQYNDEWPRAAAKLYLRLREKGIAGLNGKDGETFSSRTNPPRRVWILYILRAVVIYIPISGLLVYKEYIQY